jgi:uncharacterized protein (TIGR02246 family)
MRRLTMIVPAIAIGLAIQVLAQQTNAAQDARQAAESFVDAFNSAVQKKDAAALAALYTEDAFIVTPEGTISGRAAIEKSSAENFKVLTESAKLERVVVIGNGMRVRSGSWAGTLQVPNGPIQLKGYWATTDVLDGGTWKIRMETYNVTPPPPSSESKQ